MTRAHLALDDRWIAAAARVRRSVHPPTLRAAPVMVADRLWEKRGVLLYGAVARDEQRGVFRMWYKALDAQRQARVCYAESDDGLEWTKPDLGICDFAGSTRNNIVLSPLRTFDGPCMVFDADDAKAPYKMVFHFNHNDAQQRYLASAMSRDGLHWHVNAEPIPGTVAAGDRAQTMARRDRNGEIVLLFREGAALRDCGERVVARMTSRDFIAWSQPKLVFKSLPDDPPYMQCYSLSAFERHGVTLGLYERMHVEPDRIDTELIVSLDGETWSAIHPRTTFFANGPEDGWRSRWISPASNAPIEHDGLEYWFLSGRTGAHCANKAALEPDKAIGLATARIDGFASLGATERGGWIRTRPAPCSGELALNADVNLTTTGDRRCNVGRITAAVLDEAGKPIEGYSHETSQPLRSDTHGAYQSMQWAGAPLDALRGRTVCYELRLETARVYAARL